MRAGELGKVYEAGDTIVQQGETGDCMYVVLSGSAKAFASGPEREVFIGALGPGDVFGEMAIFRRAPRAATVRADSDVRVLTLNKRQFLANVHEDPSLAFRILQQMSNRIHLLADEVVRLNSATSSNGVAEEVIAPPSEAVSA